MRAYRIAYDGRPFYGFQRQPDVPTVEGKLLSALAALGVTDDPGDPPPGYAAAGRTDRGVSALAQTVAVRAPDWLAPRALNAELPGGIRAWASAEAPDDFHATHAAAWRAYEYHLHAPGADLAAAREVLGGLEGTHDFHNLTAVSDPDVDTTRTVLAADADRDGEFLVVRVRAEGFLHEMVRRVVTLLEATATPGGDPPAVDRVLSEEELAGPEGIGPAPAEPLVLTGAGYPDLEFETDDRALGTLREVFEDRHREAAARARVMGAISENSGNQH